MKLENKVALVTGAGSGIGEAIAHLFAGEGARLAVVDKSSEGIESTWKDLTDGGHDAMRFCVDITQSDRVTDLVDKAVEEWGRIDVLVNNAGGPCANDLLDMEDEQWDRDIELNLTATARLTKAVLPHMIKERGGSVVNIASVNGLAAYDLMAYGAAKAGVINLTKNLPSATASTAFASTRSVRAASTRLRGHSACAKLTRHLFPSGPVVSAPARGNGRRYRARSAVFCLR